MKKILALFIIFGALWGQSFAQKMIEFDLGKQFSLFRAYRNHTGYEHLSITVSKNFNSKAGFLFSQSYSRLYSKNTNNRTLIFTSTIGNYFNIASGKKISYRLTLETGILLLHSQCLYESYPIKENISGIPVKSNFAVLYAINDNVTLDFNIDAHYSFLKYGNYVLLINDPYYYQTFFFSTNLGISYKFGKTEKENGKAE